MYPNEGEMWGTVQPEAWKAHAHGGPEPVPDAIVQAARDYRLDVKELHHWVEGVNGLESHDKGYEEAVRRIAFALADPVAAHNAWESDRYDRHPRYDDAGTGVENEQERDDD